MPGPVDVMRGFAGALSPLRRARNSIGSFADNVEMAF